jgi:hypothetical protein
LAAGVEVLEGRGAAVERDVQVKPANYNFYFDTIG